MKVPFLFVFLGLVAVIHCAPQRIRQTRPSYDMVEVVPIEDQRDPAELPGIPVEEDEDDFMEEDDYRPPFFGVRFPSFFPFRRPTFQSFPSIPSFNRDFFSPFRNMMDSMFKSIQTLQEEIDDLRNRADYHNSTSETQMINGHEVTVNKTVHKSTSDDGHSVFHWKVVHVQPHSWDDFFPEEEEDEVLEEEDEQEEPLEPEEPYEPEEPIEPYEPEHQPGEGSVETLTPEEPFFETKPLIPEDLDDSEFANPIDDNPEANMIPEDDDVMEVGGI